MERVFALLFLSLITYCSALEASQIPKYDSLGIRNFIIDLDKPAYERFSEPAAAYHQEIELLSNAISSETSWFTSMMIYLSRGLLYVADPIAHSEYVGISDATGLSVSSIIQLNFAYEMLASSTSI